jgi:hypothetical protein
VSAAVLVDLCHSLKRMLGAAKGISFAALAASASRHLLEFATTAQCVFSDVEKQERL